MTAIGRSVTRVDAADKVTGRAGYTADIGIDGLCFAALVQSRIPHGEIDVDSLRLGSEIASAAPGVLTVLTPLNCPPLGEPPGDMSDDLPLERRPPLADLDVQHVGQHIAIVVADTPENAAAAAELMEVDYHRLPAARSACDVPEAPERVEPQHGWVRHGRYRPDHFVKLVDERLQDTRIAAESPDPEVTVAARFTTPVHTHYPMELSATIAQWDGDLLTVHDTTRWITGERRALAAYLGVRESNIRILAPVVGGAFGSKSFLWMHVALCAVAARVVAGPVKLVLARDQMVTSTGHRPRTRQDVVLRATSDGTITGIEHHTETETSTVAHFCEPAGLSARSLYRAPHLAVSHTVARINSPTPCFMRGPGEAPGLFALESAMDELAYTVGVDPVALRMRNDPDVDQASGLPWSGKHLAECWSRGAQRFGWHARPMAPRSMPRGDLLAGWGVATATYPGRRMPAGCRVSTGADGVVRFASATHEIGTGVRTVMRQVAADATGLPLSRIEFESGDSLFPDAPYSGASQTSATVGAAVHAAGVEWRRKRTVGETLDFTVSTGGADASGTASQSFGAHFCEVEVDEALGRVVVTRWVAVIDCGRVLNPRLARNQVMGGIVFGIGMALLEQVQYDPETAVPLGEYYVPTHADVPTFDVDFIDAPDIALDPVGVRGVGEIGTCGVPAAIANAVFHATGRRVRDLPISLEQLMSPFDGSDDAGI